MILRRLHQHIIDLLEQNASVALLGARQVGKTTLAVNLLEKDQAEYVDLEDPLDLLKTNDLNSFMAGNIGKLIILDEIQRKPDIFPQIRGIIDRQRREGKGKGLFLFLGSASMDLLKQSGESLAGRIAYAELFPIDALEFDGAVHELWSRGGFPLSLLAKTDSQSLRWRKNFIRTYLERDVQQLGFRIPAETLGRFWMMLAHQQGAIVNVSDLARSIDVTVTTANRYLDLMVDLLLVRRLKPFVSNIGKRLTKSPKIYVRDSGITHALLNISDLQSLIGHPVVGASWEAFVVENLLSVCPPEFNTFYYRTAQGAEIDLVIEISPGNHWAIEIKRSSAPVLSKGFHIACADISARQKFVVYSGEQTFSIGDGIKVISLKDMMRLLLELHV
jgi:predicted AAA+ superfamily ATPase